MLVMKIGILSTMAFHSSIGVFSVLVVTARVVSNSLSVVITNIVDYHTKSLKITCHWLNVQSSFFTQELHIIRIANLPKEILSTSVITYFKAQLVN